MKTRVWRNWVWAGVGALAISLNAADEPKAPAPPDAAPVPVEAAPPAADPPAVVAPPTATPPDANAAATPAATAFKPGLPPMLDQVVKLSESGTDEAVIRTYVEKAASPYRITGNDIVQLRERGVSQAVLLALIERSQFAAPSTTTEIIGPETQPPTNAPVAASSSEVALDYQDALAPYGAWYDMPGYGWCWQPTVVVVNADWRPYHDDGYWRWSDYGWYWQSHYTWGWAPFHYGRWYCDTSRGWLWCPDRTWGPSWVSWRNSDRHCGWAPLPPGACFTASAGWTHHGRGVGADCDFGLRSSDFTFVGKEHFSERQLSGHSLRGSEAMNAYKNTEVRNNYAAGANNHVVNRGVIHETVAATSRQPFLGGPSREGTRSGNAIPFSNNHAAVPVATGSRASVSVVRGSGSTSAINPPASAATVTRSAVAPRSTAPLGSITPVRTAQAGSVTAQRSFSPSVPQASAARSQTLQPARTFTASSAPSVSRVTSVSRTAPRSGVSVSSVSRSSMPRSSMSVPAAQSMASRTGVTRSVAPSAGNRAVMGRVSTAARSSVGHR